MDCENPTSGESVCEMIERALSIATVVFSSRLSASSGVQPSSNASRAAV